jgi:hypothetical protein
MVVDALDADIVAAFPVDADGREPGDVVLAAELNHPGAVHLGKADATVAFGVPIVHLRRHSLPCRLQPLAPRAPGGVEVGHNCTGIHGGKGVGHLLAIKPFTLHRSLAIPGDAACTTTSRTLRRHVSLLK